MPVDQEQGALLRRVRASIPLSDEETAALAGIERRICTLPKGRDIIGAGERLDAIYVLQDGWAMRHKTLIDGRRQIGNFLLPGDFVCSEALVFRHSDHTVTTLTAAKVAVVERAAAAELVLAYPRLALAVTYLRVREEAMLLERLLSVGRRTAYERAAHLFLELWIRLEPLGLVRGGNIVLPVTQEHLADCLGLSPVHMNRTLQQLRRDGLVQLRRGPSQWVVVVDVDRVRRVIDFDDHYLHRDDLCDALAGRSAMSPVTLG